LEKKKPEAPAKEVSLFIQQRDIREESSLAVCDVIAESLLAFALLSLRTPLPLLPGGSPNIVHNCVANTSDLSPVGSTPDMIFLCE
jgi:hypothetical protein